MHGALLTDGAPSDGAGSGQNGNGSFRTCCKERVLFLLFCFGRGAAVTWSGRSGGIWYFASLRFASLRFASLRFA